MPAETFDVAVVGAGPLGLALAHRLSARGLGICILEADGVANTVRRYPERLLLLSPAANLVLEDRALPGKHGSDPVTREEFLEYLTRFAQSLSVDLRLSCRVTRILPLDGRLALECEPSQHQTLLARFVVLATGAFARPHRLRVPGEEGPRVHHAYTPLDRPRGKRCLVVGGRNSALTTAASLLEAGADVTLVHRKADLDRAWPHLRAPISAAVSRREMRLLLESRVVAFGRSDAQIAHCSNETVSVVPFDEAFVMIGFDPDPSLFTRSGISLDARTSRPKLDPATHETSLAGVFVLGPASAGKQDDVQIYIHTSLPQVTHIETAIVARLASHMQRKVP